MQKAINEQLEQFLKKYYWNEIIELSGIYPEQRSLTISFKRLDNFNSTLADLLLNEPDNLLNEITQALRVLDIPNGVILDEAQARIINNPNKIKIRGIRHEHISKLVGIEGIVIKATEVYPKILTAVFECPFCGHIFSIEQTGEYKEPVECPSDEGGCGRKARKFKFLVDNSTFTNSQKVRLQEPLEDLQGGDVPHTIDIELESDITGIVTPGMRVITNGILRSKQQKTTTTKKLTFSVYMDANSIEKQSDVFEEIKISDEDEQKILELSKRAEIYKDEIKSIAPFIYGNEEIKEALLLQLFGGTRETLSDGDVTRGDIHILLIGDPGLAKSKLILSQANLAPRGVFTSGKTTSSAGLCVAPDSLIPTNSGTFLEIKDIVEKKLRDVHVFTIDDNLKAQPKNISKLWKLKAPTELISIKTQSGKKIITTPNTKLYTIQDENTRGWKLAEAFKTEDYIATIREIKAQNHSTPLTLELIHSNPIVYGAKGSINQMISKLTKGGKTKRQLAKELGLHENKLYHWWINENAKSNPHLDDLKELAKKSETPLEEIAKHITKLSLWRGHTITTPLFLNEDLLYFAGLVAGDGDISVSSSNQFSIRFSNTSEELLTKFSALANTLFGVTCGYSNPLSKRTPSARFTSRIVFEILNALGVPKSPKSHRIDLSGMFSNLPNNLISSFISGLFDTDGSVARNRTHIEFTTTSDKLARKLHLTLLKFGIFSKLRQRPPNPNEKIKSKHTKHIIDITGKENLENFDREIGFKLTSKKKKLQSVLANTTTYHTNVDGIPSAKELLRGLKKEYRISSKIVNLPRLGISRRRLSDILDHLKPLKIPQSAITELKCLANSDIAWEKVKEVNKLKGAFEYVYDLTIPSSHNFVVNGFMVHNTACVTKDEFGDGRWSLEAGALVLADRGLACIDELDKMSKNDREALHEAMEQQTVTITKAIMARLNSRCAILAAANPKSGHFDKYTAIADQINIPVTLLSRFDLIYTMMDRPQEDTDLATAKHIFKTRKKREKPDKSSIPLDILRKYIAYSRARPAPKMSNEAEQKLEQFYIGMRKQAYDTEAPIPITVRQLESLIRLSEARARARLSDTVTSEDADRVINLMTYCLKSVYIDPESGQMDVDWIVAGTTKTKRDRARNIKEIIIDLEKEHGDKVPITEIYEVATEEGIEQDKAEEIIEVMKRDGILFSRGMGVVGLVR